MAFAVALPWIKGNPLAVVVPNVLTPSECDALTSCAEGKHIPATTNVGGGRHLDEPNFRKSWQVDISCPEIAVTVFTRLQQQNALPSVFRCHVLDCISPHVHFLRYLDGGFFLPHRDGHYATLCDESECPLGYSAISLITVQLYLTDASPEHNGGQTRFLDPRAPDEKSAVDVVPCRGSCLVFDHTLMHEGRQFRATPEVPSKDTVRMEVVYRPMDPVHPETPRIRINGLLGSVDA